MLEYAAITPARNEAANLQRLAAALAAQTVQPGQWIVVDNGSTDETGATLSALAAEIPFLEALRIPGQAGVVRGGPIVRAFNAGVSVLDRLHDVIVKLDADVSFDSDYFERLLAWFEHEPQLGMASGTALEYDGDGWVPRETTGGSVWGAVRAYRRQCLESILPLEESMGWDGVDALKANLNGWETLTSSELFFRHHRLEGQRDGSRRAAWAAQGRASWFMGYRFSYLTARAVHRSLHERAALAMIPAYVGARLRRDPVCQDARVRELLRERQRMRSLVQRGLRRGEG